MTALEELAVERHGVVVDGVRSVSVELSAQEQALGFYARLGYVARPERYLERGHLAPRRGEGRHGSGRSARRDTPGTSPTQPVGGRRSVGGAT